MREIQDSDDELDDLEAEIPPRQPQSPTVQQGDNVSQKEHGTGSTESLRKALQKEHRAQFQTQPSQTEPQSSISLPEHPNERRKLSPSCIALEPFAAGSPKKSGSVTYDKKSKSNSSSTFTGVADHAAMEIGSQPIHETDWNLEGTMRESYARHEPLAMFPEPSSTIANATQTQLHIMEGVRAPVMLGMSSEVDVPRNLLPPEPSVPWSDIMKLTPGDPLYAIESSNQDHFASNSTSAVRTVGDAESGAFASQQGRSNFQKGSPLRHEVAREDSRSQGLTNWSNKPSSTNYSLKSSEMSLNVTGSDKKQSSVSTSQKKRPIEANSEHDDDLSMGLPREQYKPRPSRSRSLKVDTQNAIDYSIIPERAKKVSKRRKTTNIPSSVEIPTTPEKIQQICDMGFTPTTTKKALQQNSGDVNSTVDWLVTNRIGEDELASFSTPKKRQYTSKSEAMPMDPEGLQVIMRELNEYRRDDPVLPPTDAAHHLIANNALQSVSAEIEYAAEQIDTNAVKTPKVHVVIPMKSPMKASPKALEPSEPAKKKPKRRKTTLDQPDPEPSTASLELPVPISEKKRGRGRPKKASEQALPADLAQGASPQKVPREQQHEARQVVEVSVADGKPPAADIAANGTVIEVITGVSDEPLASALTPKSNKVSAKARTPEASCRPATPSTKGKVPYRVGLSKRARIAPLLRVLKK